MEIFICYIVYDKVSRWYGFSPDDTQYFLPMWFFIYVFSISYFSFYILRTSFVLKAWCIVCSVLCGQNVFFSFLFPQFTSVFFFSKKEKYSHKIVTKKALILLIWYMAAYDFVVLYRLRSEINLPIMRELVPHYLQDSGRVCVYYRTHIC